MLPSQRHLFDLPREIAYLNSASMGLLPKVTLDGVRGMAMRKGQPWVEGDSPMRTLAERARRAAASLIHANPDDIAHMPSVGLAVAQVGRILDIPRGTRVVVMTDDHASPVFEWQMRSARGGYTVEAVKNPGDGDWTRAILETIEDPAAAPLALLSISTLHWTEGCSIDMARVMAAARKAGARVLLDATQSVGVIPLDVRALDPDFVTFVCYKWLLGPHGRSFLYVAKRHQGGIPLDQTMSGRRDVRAEADTYFADTRYVDNARRYDIGQRDFILSMEMAAIGMEMVAGWGVENIGARLAHLTERLAAGLADLKPLKLTPAAHRTPHILSVRMTSGAIPPTLVKDLAARNVFTCSRIGGLRFSPHVYNDEADIDLCIAALKSRVA
jgi:selenocysteine lyase/cysteine desulfurase